MKTLLSLALCSLVLAGCQGQVIAGTPMPNAPTPTAAAASVPADAAQLPRYHWRLQDATDGKGQRVSALFVTGAEPVQLDFTPGRIAVSQLCNTMSSSYTLQGSTLRVGPLASTLMACQDEARNQQARAASVLFNAASFQWTLSGEPAAPALILRRPDGHILAFSGSPTPQTRFGGPPQTVFLEVAPQTRGCSHPLIPGK
ncbi:MAG TPA: META domain-containing protein, partial [Stenotrophomonas sp.]